MELTAASLLPAIDGVAGMLPPALVPPLQLARVRALASTLPFVSFVLFECHLAVRAPRTDLSVGCRTQTPAGAALLRIAGVRADALRAAETVLLEYDLDGDGPAGVPAVFAGFNAAEPVAPGVLLAVVSELRRAPASDSTEMLHRCAASLGAELRITHAGVMAGRAAAPVRVNVRATDADALRRYAAAIGMAPPRLAALDALLGDVQPFVQRLVLALDVGPQPSPRFGVECYPGVADGGPDRWPAFLERLLERSLCTRAEFDALREWAGAARPPAQWPAGRRRLAEFLGPRRPDYLARSLNHVKLVAESAAPLRAKAYLALNHLWHEPPA